MQSREKKPGNFGDPYTVIAQEGKVLYGALHSVRRSYTVYCAASSTLFTAVRLLAGPVLPHRTICKRGQKRSAGSARLGRFWRTCGPPGRGRAHSARIRRVRTEAHGRLPCLRHYAARVRRVQFFSFGERG